MTLAPGELETLADRLRHAIARMRIERIPGVDFAGQMLPWDQLTESERNQWRDHARACVEVTEKGRPS